MIRQENPRDHRNEEESFCIRVFQDHLETPQWHYHREYELSFVTEGSGQRIVGDSVEDFHPGDLIFIGPHLPHVWYPGDQAAHSSSGRTMESVYMQFDHEVLPDGLLVLPEYSSVRRALKLAEQGLHIHGESLNTISRIMLQLPYQHAFPRLLHLFEILDLIGKSHSYTLLASHDYVKQRFDSTNKRLKAIHDFLMRNYREEVALEQIAELVHMAPASVSRFFKQQTGLSLFEYLNKIKVDFAIQLLLNTDLNIMDISFDSGFNNLSHFNKQFRKLTGRTPSEFRRLRKTPG